MKTDTPGPGDIMCSTQVLGGNPSTNFMEQVSLHPSLRTLQQVNRQFACFKL